MGEIVHKRSRKKKNQPKSQIKTFKQMSSDNLKERIYVEYMKRGGHDSGVCMTDIVCEFRPNATRQANSLYGWRILNDPDVKKRLSSRNGKRIERTILSYEERLQYLTSILMGEIEPDAETKDRLRALDIMNRMEGIYVNNNVNVNYTSKLSVDQEREIVQNRLNNLLGAIDGDVVKEEVIENGTTND